jgi:lysine-N-methylase
MNDKSAPSAPDPSAITRPRLGDHVAARRYLRSDRAADAGGAESIVLHDTRAQTLVVLGQREWAILRCADGSRDLPGLRLAAHRRAVRVGSEDLASFVAELSRAGLLSSELSSEGPLGAEPSEAPTSAPPPRRDAPLVRLAGFLLRCDGRGSCCRIYGSTLFSPAEATRAAALCPAIVPADMHGERAFTPEAGSSYRLAGGAERARCVSVVDGACAFLSRDGSCSLHSTGGAAAKPLGCRLFPADFADDGAAICVSVLPECACVMRSIDNGSGVPIVAAAARTGADLDPATFVRIVPASIELGAGRCSSKARYLAWAHATGSLLGGRGPRDAAGALPDLAAWAWLAGESIERRGELAPLGAFGHDALAPRAEIVAALLPVRRFVERLLERWQHFRHDHDLSVATAHWLHAALARLEADGPSPLPRASPALARREAFCLRAWLHSHQLVGEVPLGSALRECALRMLLARTMATTVAPPAPDGSIVEVADEPLALVNAWWRAHGVVGRADRRDS